MGSPDAEKLPFRFDARLEDRSVFHDVEIAKRSAGFFDEAFLAAFGSESVREELDGYLKERGAGLGSALQNLRREFLDHLDETVVSEVILEVLQSDVIGHQDYLDVLTRLTDLAEKLIDRGRFEETLNIYNTLYPQTLGGKFRNEASSTIEYFFRSESFVAAFLKALKVWARQNRDSATRLARALRPQIFSPLLDAALAEKGDAGLRKLYLAMLVEFRSDLVEEIVKRLDDDDPEAVRILLYLLRKCGSYKQADHARPLARHRDPRIHTAAVRTLLHFRVKDGIPPLKLYLQGADEGLRKEGVELAGTYRVKEAVPDLLEILDEKDVFGAKSGEKRGVIKALGRIGDPSALDALMKIVRTRGLLRRAQVEDLKLEVFRSLKYYPLQATEPLLKIGVKTREKGEIHEISSELLKSLYAMRQRSQDA